MEKKIKAKAVIQKIELDILPEGQFDEKNTDILEVLSFENLKGSQEISGRKDEKSIKSLHASPQPRFDETDEVN